MILLDTNVVSAMMRLANESAVEHWLDTLRPDTVWTTTVTLFEVGFGLKILSAGRRRTLLEAAFAEAINDVLGGRVMPFDHAAAGAAAAMAADCRREGRTTEIRDLLIAGIAAAQKATLATRNLRHFETFGIALVDPWNA
ncbi:MAG: type II toxin-antitoxin system VapC family toxin [Rhodospirillales bacterium]|nr:type II toxin-antitoxin system VapC family toxin [Rhodospirillales bacterium]